MIFLKTYAEEMSKGILFRSFVVAEKIRVMVKMVNGFVQIVG